MRASRIKRVSRQYVAFVSSNSIARVARRVCQSAARDPTASHNNQSTPLRRRPHARAPLTARSRCATSRTPHTRAPVPHARAHARGMRDFRRTIHARQRTSFSLSTASSVACVPLDRESCAPDVLDVVLEPRAAPKSRRNIAMCARAGV